MVCQWNVSMDYRKYLSHYNFVDSGLTQISRERNRGSLVRRRRQEDSFEGIVLCG